MNRVDPTGLEDRFLNAVFDKSDKVLTVKEGINLVPIDGMKSVPVVTSEKRYDASSNVKARENPTKSGKPIKEEGIHNYDEKRNEGRDYVIPKEMPSGDWNITGVRRGNNRDEGDYVVTTDAHQRLTSLRYDESSESFVPQRDKRGNIIKTEDFGYNFHGGGKKPQNFVNTTLGCGRLRENPTATSGTIKDFYKQVEKFHERTGTWGAVHVQD